MLLAEEYLDLPIPSGEWVVHHFLPKGGLAILYAPPKVGKSFLALQMAAAVASGESAVCGLAVPTKGPVAYLQLDTPRALWHERMLVLQSAGLDYGEGQFYVADRDTPGVPYPFNIFKDWLWLQATIDKIKPVMLVVDTFRECFQGEENDSNVLQSVFGLLTKAARGSAVLLVHHPKKPNELGIKDLMNDIRGSSYIPGRVDGVMAISGGDTLIYQSRASELREVKVERDEVGRWVLNESDQQMQQAVEAVCKVPFPSEAARATALSLQFPGMTQKKAAALIKGSGLATLRKGVS